jgi:uncharacterized protein DUF3226
MPKYGFLVVEGPHDVEFVYRLLSPFGLSRVQLEKQLDAFLSPLIPRDYPPGGDLQKRMTTPLFLQSATHALAIHSAVGDSRLVETIEENASILPAERLTGIGIIFDADKDKTVSAASRYGTIKMKMQAIGFTLPDNPGQITAGTPRLGAFVLPDNSAPGTLEDLLLECGQLVYPGLLRSAASHVDGAVQDATLELGELEEVNKPAGKNKAILGSVANILRPGKAIQVSLQDNRWLRGPSLALPRVKVVQDFLTGLFELR